MKRCKLQSYGLSDVGLVRRNNEDVFLELSQHQFYVLADGMGGHNAGEVAAQETVVFLSNCIDKLLKQTPSPLSHEQLISHLCGFINASNDRIYQLGQENNCYQGMGTTLTSMLFYGESVICTHVGDSRIYRYRNHQLKQLTYDHTLKNKLLQQGQLEEAIRKGIRYKNVLTKAIGAFQQISPDIFISDIASQDLYLMCSDGLSDYVSDSEICAILNANSSLEERTQRLVDRAKSKGGFDNITVLMTHLNDSS